MAFNLGNLKVGLLLDAGQVFSGLRAVNKELLGLQRTQERFNQLAVPQAFTREEIAAAKERLLLLKDELAQQKLKVFQAQENIRIIRQEAEIIRNAAREEQISRQAALRALRDQAAERIRSARAEVARIKGLQEGFAAEERLLGLQRQVNEQIKNGVNEEKRRTEEIQKQQELRLQERRATLAAAKAETERLRQIGGRMAVDSSGVSVFRRERRERQEEKDIAAAAAKLREESLASANKLLKTEQEISANAEDIAAKERSLNLQRKANTEELKKQQAVLAGVRDDTQKTIKAEVNAIKASEDSTNRQLIQNKQKLGIAKDELRIEKETQQVLEDQESALKRNVSASEKAAEAARKQQVIAENIRDAILALGLGTALQSLNKFSAEAALLAARVENLGTVLRNLGTISGNSLGQLTLYEEQVKKLGITTQATRQVLSLLAANQQDLAQSATLARVAQDAAAIAGINSSEAAERLVIAVERLDTRLLRSLGIVVNLREVYARFARETGRAAETLSAAEKQQLLYNAVIERGAAIQGTYEASLKDAFKQFTSLDRITQEARREFGERFVPVFEKYVETITSVVGTDDNSGLRGLNKEYGKGLAATQAFITVAGAATISVIGLARAYALLGIQAKASAVASLGLAGALRAVGAALVTPAGLLVTAVGAVAAGYVYYGAQAREAAASQRIFTDALTATIQRGVELEDSVQTIRALGNASFRTTQQEEELGRAFRVVSGLFPEYSAKLKAAEKNTIAYEQALKSVGARLGLFTEAEAKQAQETAAQIGGALVTRLRVALNENARQPAGGLGSRTFARDRLAQTFGITREDLAVLVGDIRDTKRELEILQKFAAVKDSDAENFAKDLARAFGLAEDELVQLSNQFKTADTRARAFQDALNAVAAQRFSRELERQSGAAETFSDEIKRQQTRIRQELAGTAAEDIEQFRKIRTALAVRFQTEDELRKGAQRQRDLAISSARQELQLEIDIAAAKVKEFKGAKDSLELKQLELDLQRKRNALQAREVAAEDEAARTVKQGIADLETRARALKTIEERIARTIKLNEKLRDVAREQNNIDEAGLRARRAGRDVNEVEAQVNAVKQLLEIQKSRAETEEKIQTIREESNRALKDQRDQLIKLQLADPIKNRELILQLQKSITEEENLTRIAIEQQNEALRAQQIEVRKLAQDQLNDLKNLRQGFNTARQALETFDSFTEATKRSRENQQAQTQERIRLEQAGASQIEVEASIAELREKQAADEAAKRQELEKIFRTEQQRSKGAFQEQRLLERELKNQKQRDTLSLQEAFRNEKDPKKQEQLRRQLSSLVNGSKDPFAEERGIRAQETAKILGLMRPDGKPLSPGEAEKALEEFARKNPNSKNLVTLFSKNPAAFPGLIQGQSQAEKMLSGVLPGTGGDPSGLLASAQAIGDINREREKLLASIAVFGEGVNKSYQLDKQIFKSYSELQAALQARLDELTAGQKQIAGLLNKTGTDNSKNATARKVGTR